MKRILGSALGVLLLTTGLIAGGAGHASAASACWDSGCNGHDPHVSPYAGSCMPTSWTTGTYASGAAVATVINYWSAACNSNWSEATLNSAAISAHWQITVAIWEENSTKTSNIAASTFPSNLSNSGQTWEDWNGKLYGGASGWPAWSDMVGGQNYTRGIANVYNNSGTYIGAALANQ